jgi:hypothetical protein
VAQTLDASRFRRLNRLASLSIGLFFIAGGLFLVRDGSDSFETAVWMILYTLAFALVQGAFIVFRYRHFKCPVCGSKAENIEEWRTDEGSPVLKLCKHCDIFWRIGNS